ncbi:MAG: hypothetical protein NZM12_09525, partial [Steroidobacteraceae bacterium]|nr:hypothetical protein [Steroidobacteraceae bacterium]
SGTGKTHLLLAAAAAAQSGGRRARYLPMRELRAIGAAALAGAGSCACIGVDDIDAVAEQRDYCEALLALWRDCEERGTALLLSSRASLGALRWALPDLGSRVAGSAEWHRLRPLDEAGQAEVLRHRCAALGLELPEETRIYLQQRYPRDLTPLCALLDRLDEAALAAQRRLTIPFVRSVLAQSDPFR